MCTNTSGLNWARKTSVGDLDRYIVNGAHDAGKLQDTLDGFINRFVLCPSCKNPETHLSVSVRDGIIHRDCMACGTRSKVDLHHKLSSVILKHPPEKQKKTKKAAVVHENGLDDSNGGDGTSGGDENDDDDLTRRINADVAVLPRAEDGADDVDNWGADTSAAAQSARIQELEGVLKKGLVVTANDDDDDDDDNDAEENPYEQLGVWIEENSDAKDVDIFRKAQSLGIGSKHRTLQVLAQALYDDSILQQIPKRVGLFKKVDHLCACLKIC